MSSPVVESPPDTSYRWQKSGLDTLYVPDEYAHGKILAIDIVDQGTGELLASANDEITADLLAKLHETGVQSFDTLFVNDVDRGPYISDTCRADATTNQIEAQVEIYRMMRPGEPPTKEAAQTFVP